MKDLSQFCMILGFTLAGEALQRLIPLPVPASVWGLALLFLALCFGIVKLEQVKDTATFLISIMALLFVSPAVGIVENWPMIRPQLLPIFLLLAGSTCLVFGISGCLAQLLLKKGGGSRA